MLLALQTRVSTILLIILSIILLVLAILWIIHEIKHYKKDKVMFIGDVVSLKELMRLINFRIDSSKKNKKQQTYFSLLLVSIDGFDQIKDYISTKNVKEYRNRILELLRMELPKCSKIAITEKDETFLIYIPEVYDEENLIAIAQKFKNSAERQVKINNTIPIQKNASIAITAFPTQGKTADELINNLNMTMYKIKKTGGNDIVGFYKELVKTGSYVEHFKELEDTIENQDLEMEFNPIFDMTKNKLVGVESLLYWYKEDKASKYTDFMPYLEESSDDFWIAIWVLEKALVSNINILKSNLMKEYYITIPAGINLLKNELSADVFKTTLDKYQIPSKFVTFEIENLFNIECDARLTKNLLQLQSVGFNLMVDMTNQNDFEILNQYKIDIIKINASKLLENSNATSIIEFAKNNNKKILVYNVETKEQKQDLKNMNVSLMQGSLFGANRNKEDLLTLVDIK